jgi:N-carbamoylputrescine amidase
VVSVNRVGFEPDTSGVGAGARFWGNSFVAGCQGELLAVAGTEEEQVLVVELDRRRSEDVRRIWPYLRDRRIDAYSDLTLRYRD